MGTWLETLWQDIRYGSRMLGRAPGFTAIAILSLAVGIGANCAIFSFADALLLRPLPVARPGDVLTVGSTISIEALGVSGLASSYRDYVDIRDRNRSFSGLTAFSLVTAGFADRPGAVPVLKMGMLASDNLFDVMGVRPALGRPFLPEEGRVPGRDAVVVLGHALWEQHFASDPSVVGRRVDFNGRPFTVIGVAPREFTGLNTYVRADFFVPLMMSSVFITDPKAASLEARDVRNLSLKGRLAPGVSQGMAQTELTAIGADLARAYPDTNKNRSWAVRTELQARIAQSPPDAMLVAMLATLALAVLLVACANVAGLLASRAPVRAREMAMRLAIGAGRRRLVRQLVTESLLTALAGGALGLGVGYAGITLFRQVELPTDLPILLAFRMDHRALRVQSGRVGGQRGALRPAAGDSGVSRGPDWRDEGGRRRFARPPPALGAHRPGGRPGCRVGGAARRRAVHVSRFRQPARQRARVSHGPPPHDERSTRASSGTPRRSRRGSSKRWRTARASCRVSWAWRWRHRRRWRTTEWASSRSSPRGSSSRPARRTPRCWRLAWTSTTST